MKAPIARAIIPVAMASLDEMLDEVVAQKVPIFV